MNSSPFRECETERWDTRRSGDCALAVALRDENNHWVSSPNICLSRLLQSAGKLGTAFLNRKLVSIDHDDQERPCSFMPLPTGLNLLGNMVEYPNIVAPLLHLTGDP
jgi:hypothetical protein